jgi:ribonuclease BN (tRNA processing enzyme)
VDDLELTFVGTANAFASGGMCWNGFLANHRFLFEAPPSALMALHRLGTEINEIEAVLISHHHGDHFLGLPFLLLQWKYFGRHKPVSIVGPPGTEQLARDICDRVYPGLFEHPHDIDWVVAEPGKKFTVGGLEVEPVRMEHDDKLDLCLGFACTLEGRRFGYTGDSSLCDGVRDLARHSEVLVSECASRNRRSPLHMNLVDDMPQVRAALAPESHLILTHLDGHIDSAGLPLTTVAQDFATYRFPR